MAEDPDPKDPDPKDPEPFDEARAKEKIRKANAEAAGLRERLKEAESKAAKLDELENAGKSEIEKATAAVAAAERRAQEAEAKALRLEVATSKGLNTAQAKRLVGNTQEELEADADELLKTFPAGDGGKGDGKTAPSKPREDLRGGGDPTSEPAETSPTKLAETVPRL